MIMSERKANAFAGNIGAALALDAKMLNEDGEFEGYASTFGNVDQGDDIMVAGCYADSLARRPADRVKMLYQHRTDVIIGKWIELREDAKGLYAKGKLFLNIQNGREVYEIMKEGQLDGLSIGFRTLVDEYDRTLGVRRVVKCDLREVSLVTFPMNEMATVQLVKNELLPSEREFEGWLTRDAGFSRSQAKAIIAGGYKALRNERDAVVGDDGVKDALHTLARMMRS